jgi:hypothetical protein
MIQKLPLVALRIVLFFLRDDTPTILALSEVFPEWIGFFNLEKLEIMSPFHSIRTLRDLSNIYLISGLRELSMTMVKVDGVGLKLPASLKYSKLERLELFHVSEIPESLGEIQSLKSVIFWQSTFNTFPKSFNKLTNLEKLELRYCYQVPDSVLEDMKKLPSLKYINVLLHHYRRDIAI